MKIQFNVTTSRKAGAGATAQTMSSARKFDLDQTSSPPQEHPNPHHNSGASASPPEKMAPVAQSDQKVMEDQLKDVIQDLYQIMVQVNSYDQANTTRSSKDVLEGSIKQLHASLQKVHSTASSPSCDLPLVPPELISYVDSGRNPDIYTREFVEGARRSNQLMKGKMEAFADFRDVLAREMAAFFPELRSDVGRVLDGTGGKRDVVLEGDA